MLTIVWIITIITSVLCICYVALIGSYAYGWVRTLKPASKTKGDVTITVVIAARNEEENIGKCLQAVLLQNYDGALYDVIVVDDHSEDRTSSIVEELQQKHPRLKLIRLEEGKGKKAAISAAVAQSKAKWIVTTDADCSMSSGWLSSIAASYATSNLKMMVGPVAFEAEKGVFQRMQSLELMALVGSTAGSLYFNRAIMCNGANLGYSREIFNEINGFEGIDGLASGDDVLLMYKIAAKYPGSIGFLKDREAIVRTSAQRSLGGFMDQRKRWASKGFTVLNTSTRTVSLLVYLFCFFLLLMGGLVAFGSIKSTVYQPFLQICLILLGFKCVIDFLLLFLAASFFRKRGYLSLFLPEQVLYIFYVVLIGAMGNIGRYSWKGRTY